MEELALEKSHPQNQTAAHQLTPIKGVFVVFGVAIIVVIYLVITHFLGIAEFWAGFLWLFYWAAIEHMNFNKLNSAVVGASVGLLTAGSLHYLPQLIPDYGLILALCLVVALVYCQVMGWMGLFVNNATMMFLTVGTIPHLQTGGDFTQMFSALFTGVVFFAGLIWIGSQVIKKRRQ